MHVPAPPLFPSPSERTWNVQGSRSPGSLDPGLRPATIRVSSRLCRNGNANRVNTFYRSLIKSQPFDIAPASPQRVQGSPPPPPHPPPARRGRVAHEILESILPREHPKCVVSRPPAAATLTGFTFAMLIHEVVGREILVHGPQSVRASRRSRLPIYPAPGRVAVRARSGGFSVAGPYRCRSRQHQSAANHRATLRPKRAIRRPKGIATPARIVLQETRPRNLHRVKKYRPPRGGSFPFVVHPSQTVEKYASQSETPIEQQSCRLGDSDAARFQCAVFAPASARIKDETSAATEPLYLPRVPDPPRASRPNASNAAPASRWSASS